MSQPQRACGSDFANPYTEIDRTQWAALAPNTPLPLGEREIAGLRGLGEPLDVQEVTEVYHPLSHYLSMIAAGTQQLMARSQAFLGHPEATSPFVIGIAGSVAVGKSTIARLLQALLSRWEDTPRVDLVTTDAFLYTNTELERRGIAHRKGFPESYDRRSLLRFVRQVKGGAPELRVPIYSHLIYDILPGEFVTVRQPDVLIVEGLNVLQPASAQHPLAVSDLFDVSIYVDARTRDIAKWYEDRFIALQHGAFTDPDSYFRRFANLSEPAARMLAGEYWKGINEPNLLENIRPTRSRASLILRKGADHTVQKVLVRKV